jgi:hypothetical protein
MWHLKVTMVQMARLSKVGHSSTSFGVPPLTQSQPGHTRVEDGFSQSRVPHWLRLKDGSQSHE